MQKELYKKYILTIFSLGIFFLFFFIYSNFINLRPYYLTLFTDIENYYYYNAKLIFNNYLASGVDHPGTLVFFLSSLVFYITGDSLEKTQTFFLYNYFIIVFVNLFVILYAVKFFFF